ncbi:MAG: endonuclease MutS2 [Myxococcota bacterium]
MNLPPRTLEDLGFADIRRSLAARSRTEPGKSRALARTFLDSASEIYDALALIEEARKLLAEPLSLPLTGVTDVRTSLERAAKGGMLEPKELIAVTGALFSFERTKEALEERREGLPAMATISRRIPDLDKLATRLDRCFESGGEISDRASPELREARERTRGLHKSIKARLDRLLHDEKFLANLREPYFSVRHDRYVLPVLAQHRAQVPGIVHNASQSGQTLFVEPQELIGLGNDLAIAQSMVLEEERRVLIELSDAVGRHAKEIAEGVEACAMLDEAEGAARLANELDAASPHLEPAEGGLHLKGLRHPLLVLRGPGVIANDVSVSGEARGLVVSGPNAGGKTVTLTGVGLCAVMLRSGLPIPAEAGSRMPLFASIHTAVGDAQDLAQGLSTFSAHVTELKEIGHSVTKGSLVLIDEIAADTDPKEGAAIAIAVLEDLIERGGMVLVTTHLEELKALAHLDKRFVNARVGFDPHKMAPTYRLQLGAAGASSAIDIAARVGLSEKVCTRARELVLGAGGPLAKALAAAEAERRALEEERERLKTQTDAAEKARRDHEESLASFEARRKREELQLRERLAAELQSAQGQVRELLASLRAQASAKEAEGAAKDLAARLEEEQRAIRAARAEAEKAESPPGPFELRVGAWVRHIGLDRDVEILELADGEAVVAVGPLRTRVPVSELAPAKKAKPATRFSQDKAENRLEKAKEAAAKELALSAATCDVRGLRADEALRSVEQFLDRVLREGEEGALIIHGHGTGALKQSIRQYLDGSPYVRSYRPGESHEGGDGVTLVALRS